MTIEMQKEGFQEITNIDNSPKCIEIMKERYFDLPRSFMCKIFKLS